MKCVSVKNDVAKNVHKREKSVWNNSNRNEREKKEAGQ